MSNHGRDYYGNPLGECPGLSRRAVLQTGLCGLAGMLLAQRHGFAAAPAAKPAKAKAVIQIWMWGGPTHIDTFDPKPEAGRDYGGPLLTPIKTNADGIMIGELLPVMAKQADKFSIIRGMTHGNNGHETASYMVQTGRKTGGRDVFPCAGAVVSLFKGVDAGYKGLIPPYVVLTQPQGRFSEAGFMGSRYKPFATGGDPGKQQFLVEGVASPTVTKERQEARRNLLTSLNTMGAAMKGNADLEALSKSEDQAYDLILGDAGKVFNLAEEKDELRDRYGRSSFGQSCLMARRLVERGVPYITINYKGWDTHKEHFQLMRKNLPDLDKGMGTLLQDLAERGLLDSTIVWWGGEFGRTPQVQWEPPWNGGRGHYGKVFSTVIAGGGFKGGHVVGSSDAKAENVKDRPVYPWDLIGSMYELLGIDPSAKLPHPEGKAITAIPSKEEGYETGGRLTEIM